MKKSLRLIIKILGSSLAIIILFNQVDVAQALRNSRNISPVYLIGAFLLFNLSQLTSAIRLNTFFRCIEVRLDEFFNIRLYYLGMFYNLIVPGGIGGDAFKGYLLNKYKKAGVRQLAIAMLADRLSGLSAISILIVILAFFIEIPAYLIPYRIALVPFLIAGLVIYFWIFPSFRKVFIPASTLSILVQLLQVATIGLLLVGTGEGGRYPEYFLIFLVSSIATVIPITIGGLGLRELVFLYGAEWFGLNPEVAVSFSLTFFLLTVISSLPGLYFHLTIRKEDWTNQSALDKAG